MIEVSNEPSDEPNPDQEVLDDARAFLAERIEEESQQRLQALDDLNFLVGDQWPAEVRAARRADNRPCLTINKLPTFLHQVTNDQRQNRPGIKVHPVDDDADIETADVIQGLIRHIEYASNADVAYDRAVNSAAQVGFGYFRIVTEYCAQDSFDQDIKFKSVRNPFTVYLGPHIEPDGSDMMKAMVTEEMDRGEFKREYPKAQAGEIQRGIGDNNDQWVTKDKVRVAEFFRVETMPARLVMVQGRPVFEDEIQPDPLTGVLPQVDLDRRGEPITRMSAKRFVRWYKVTGAEILDRAEIPCNWIPIFPVYGDEYDVDGKLIRSGLIRNAKDPARMYNVWITSATEEIALRPKTPYIGAEGQFEDHEAKWDQANVRSFSRLEYKPVSIDGTLAPPPQRQPMADVPQGVLAMAVHASDDIKATTGIYDASLGARSNETSGRAITARQKESDVSNFHYTDGLIRTIRHAARCILWMLPRVYDTERMVRILGEDEDVQHVTINKPKTPQEIAQEQAQLAQKPPSKQMVAIKQVANDLTVGEYDVTVSAGPSYSTLRQETADAMIQVGQAWPKLWDVAGDKLVHSLDWHGADEISERIKRTIPAQILGPQDGEPDPAALLAQEQQKSQQLEQALQAAAQHAQELETQLKAGIAKAQISKSQAIQVAEINADKSRDVAEIQNMGKLLQANLPVPQQFVDASLEGAEPLAPQQSPAIPQVPNA